VTPVELSRTVLHAVCRAVEDGVLQAPVPASVSVERPRPGGRGDYATNVALRLAGPAGQQARAVAEMLRDRVGQDPRIERVEITGPGFLNFTLRADAESSLVRAVRARGAQYGHGTALDGLRVTFAPGDEPRVQVLTHTVVQLLRAQGAVAHTQPDGGERLRAVAATGPDPVQQYGSDAGRWALLSAAAHDRPRDAAAFLVQRESNPLFKVRYAFSRTHALTRAAAQLDLSPGPETPEAHADAPDLAAAIGDYPGVLTAAARHRAPDRLARHLDLTAEAFLAFQPSVLPNGKPMAAHRARLALAEAAGTVLAGGLSLLGISAPEYL
jgi:arginyl-tRNA synthetase